MNEPTAICRIGQVRARLEVARETIERMNRIAPGLRHERDGVDERTVSIWRRWAAEVGHGLDAAEFGYWEAVRAIGLVVADLPDNHPAITIDRLEAPPYEASLMNDLERALAAVARRIGAGEIERRNERLTAIGHGEIAPRPDDEAEMRAYEGLVRAVQSGRRLENARRDGALSALIQVIGGIGDLIPSGPPHDEFLRRLEEAQEVVNAQYSAYCDEHPLPPEPMLPPEPIGDANLGI